MNNVSIQRFLQVASKILTILRLREDTNSMNGKMRRPARSKFGIRFPARKPEQSRQLEGALLVPKDSHCEIFTFTSGKNFRNRRNASAKRTSTAVIMYLQA